MGDLEQLMQHREQRIYEINNSNNATNSANIIQTAEKHASMYDFIKMVDKILAITMKDVRFAPDMDNNIVENADQKLECPVITYKIVSRVPKKEYKPRIRQIVEKNPDDPNDQRIGEIYGQKFECVLQFNIFGSVYDVAEQVMERFEEVIFTYTGYFKKNGVAELLFKEQLTDENYDIFRQQVAIRNIRYYVEIEKLIPIFQDKINEIETLGL